VRTGSGRESEAGLARGGPRPDLIAEDLAAAACAVASWTGGRTEKE